MSDNPERARVLTPHEQIARVFWRHLAQAPKLESVRRVRLRRSGPSGDDYTMVVLQGEYGDPSTLDLFHNDVLMPDSDEWLVDKITSFIQRVL